MSETDVKKCNVCLREKQFEEFKSKKSGKGLNACCHNCLQSRYKFMGKNPTYLKEYQQKNKEKQKIYNKTHYNKYKRKRPNINNEYIKKYVDCVLDEFKETLRQEQKILVKEMLGGMTFNLS